MLGLLVMTASLTGCTLKAPTVPDFDTGNIQWITWTEVIGMEFTGTELTWTELTWTISEELSNAIDSGVVPMVEGSEEVIIKQDGVVTEVKKLIEERNTQPKDESKLTEEDISLMEKAIQTISDLFK